MSGEQKKPEIVAFSRRKPREIVKFNFRISKKIIALFLVVTLSVSVAVFLIIRESAVLTVGDTRLTKKQYDTLLEQAKKRSINKEGATFQIILAYKYIEAAKKLNITIDDKVLTVDTNLSKGTESTNNEFGRLMAKQAYIENYLETKKRDGYEGYAFFYPFSRYFFSSEAKPSDPKFNDPAAIETDRKAAQTKATQAREDLATNKQKPEDIVADIKADSSLVYGNASNKSGKFIVDKQGFALNQTTNDASASVSKFFDKLVALKEGEASSIIEDVQRYRDTNGKAQTKNAAYYFVYKTKNMQVDTEFVNNFNETVKNIKVKNETN